MPILRGTYTDYKFIGYDKTDNLPKLLKAIKSKEGEDKNILERIYKGVKQRETIQLPSGNYKGVK